LKFAEYLSLHGVLTLKGITRDQQCQITEAITGQSISDWDKYSKYRDYTNLGTWKLAMEEFIELRDDD